MITRVVGRGKGAVTRKTSQCNVFESSKRIRGGDCEEVADVEVEVDVVERLRVVVEEREGGEEERRDLERLGRFGAEESLG